MGKVTVTFEDFPPSQEAAPEGRRSNAQSPSPRKHGKGRTTPKADRPETIAEPSPSPDTPDKPPSALPDEALKPYHLEWMRRLMRRRRAKEQK